MGGGERRREDKRKVLPRESYELVTFPSPFTHLYRLLSSIWISLPVRLLYSDSLIQRIRTTSSFNPVNPSYGAKQEYKYQDSIVMRNELAA